MVCLQESHFAAILILVIVGVAVIVGSTVWYYVKRRCAREKLGQMPDSDVHVPILVQSKTPTGRYQTRFAESRAR